MTPTQRRVWLYVRAFGGKNGYPPTLSEIADHLQVTRQSVHEVVQRLVRDKWLKLVESVGHWIAVD